MDGALKIVLEAENDSSTPNGGASGPGFWRANPPLGGNGPDAAAFEPGTDDHSAVDEEEPQEEQEEAEDEQEDSQQD